MKTSIFYIFFVILALLYMFFAFIIFGFYHDVGMPSNYLFGMLFFSLILAIIYIENNHSHNINRLKIQFVKAAKMAKSINYDLFASTFAAGDIRFINNGEFKKNKIIIASIVVNEKFKSENLPNGCPPEFFWNFPNIPKNLKRKRPSYEKEPLTPEEIEFIKTEQQKVFDFWKNKPFEEFTDYIDI
jgi:hypothetical protein